MVVVEEGQEQTSNQITTLSDVDRDMLIAYLYIIEGREQLEIAEQFGITQSRVSQIVTMVKESKDIQSRLMPIWEKSYTLKAMRLSTGLLDKVDPETHPAQKRVVDSATLVDKTRLINDMSTANISYADHSKALSTLIDEQRRLANELGLDADVIEDE